MLAYGTCEFGRAEGAHERRTLRLSGWMRLGGVDLSGANKLRGDEVRIELASALSHGGWREWICEW